MSGTRVNVVVTCTARKTLKAPKALCLRNVPGRTILQRFEGWAGRMEQRAALAIPAMELYCGGSWSIVRAIHKDPKLKNRLRLWIISAGQGLVTPETQIPPYAATFSNGHKDSIITPKLRGAKTEEWWRALTEWRRQSGAKIASIEEIAKMHPDEALIIAVSKEYLTATYDDIRRARSALGNTDRLVVICSGAQKNGGLETNLLPCDARFENHFRCCRTDLNSRLLAAILQKYEPAKLSARKLARDFAEEMRQMPAAKHPDRIRSTDEAVEKFIVEQLRADKAKTHTNLLRSYRSQGFACEQGRFRELFRKAQRIVEKG